ncbi:Na(+)/H(+) exchange regulatory cofactor NHE-RF1a isoform X2 [Betta splendens]|uniref:Na(+)/H(+) exchange regulatory cofactor NHE-RF n=1 Tax=Betta splendens TaxID=158456 RepID=A0A6P7L868_BETSP|nr:Na(+)/H(+) exchange regulatory cofactor NHE-RF1a isoform X2 [Betta splendens]
MTTLRPRLCVMEKGSGGYGFHLHGEKGKSGQFIRLVEPDTPAFAAGLLAGDRLVFVNGECVDSESHQQVVSRIRATDETLELIVVDADTAELLNKHNLRCRKEFVTEGIPLPRESAQTNGAPTSSYPDPRANVDVPSERLSVSSGTKEEREGLRPRLCQLKKGPNGYGFNLHSEKSRPGQFIRAVDEDSPAQTAGLKPQDKIVQVNGLSVVGKQHSEVVAAIKAGGNETQLLVVDPETDKFFNRCNVQPTEKHITGPLPEAVSEEATAGRKAKMSVSSSSSSASSSSSLPAETSSLPAPQIERASAAESLNIHMSLAQAKEKAHQKRAAKKAPTMDWSKRNELFSNL